MNERPLDDLAAFATVARTRNFRRAALELGISASSLSQRMRELEARLGVRLLNRTTRSVAPTEAGERLFTRLVPALRDVGDATREVQDMGDRPSGRLRINGPEPALRWALAPLVGPFLRRYPDIALEIVADSALIDIVSAGFDAGIRYEERLAQDMIAVPLGPPERYVLVAAPALLAAWPTLRSPRGLPGRPCIVTRFRSGFVLPWEFRRGSRTLKFVPTGPLVASHPELQLRAAIDGVGYLMTLEAYARSALDRGDLVTVLEDWCPPSPGPYLYYPGRRQTPPALAAFVAFVKESRHPGSPSSPGRPAAVRRFTRSPRMHSR